MNKGVTSVTAAPDSKRQPIVWFFREKPEPEWFVRPEDGEPCALVKVTLIKPMPMISRRVGGEIPAGADLRVEESVPSLGISLQQILTVGFHTKARSTLPKEFHDIGRQDHVDSGLSLQMPIGEVVFVTICKKANYYSITYAVMSR